MTDKPISNATPEEKLRTLFQDQALRNEQKRKDASTFSQFANSEANQDAGRFAAINKFNVVGSAPAPEYPRLPEGSWTNDPTGVEPPLGFVDEAPIVGEYGEVQESIERLAGSEATAPAASSSVPPVEQQASPDDAAQPTEVKQSLPSASASGLPASPTPTTERRKPQR